MQTHTIKTTLTFSPVFLQKLRQHARKNKTSMSRTIEERLHRIITEEEQRELQRTYHALDQLFGIGSHGITDASQTIDETLYGENGVWKGSRAE